MVVKTNTLRQFLSSEINYIRISDILTPDQVFFSLVAYKIPLIRNCLIPLGKPADCPLGELLTFRMGLSNPLNIKCIDCRNGV